MQWIRLEGACGGNRNKNAAGRRLGVRVSVWSTAKVTRTCSLPCLLYRTFVPPNTFLLLNYIDKVIQQAKTELPASTKSTSTPPNKLNFNNKHNGWLWQLLLHLLELLLRSRKLLLRRTFSHESLDLPSLMSDAEINARRQCTTHGNGRLPHGVWGEMLWAESQTM